MEFIRLENHPKNMKFYDNTIITIALATNSCWENVYRNLVEESIKIGHIFNSPLTYRKYLFSLGWKLNFIRRKGYGRITIEEFCNTIAQPNTTYIVKTFKHLAVVTDKKLYSTWHCGYKPLVNYWVSKEVEQ